MGNVLGELEGPTDPEKAFKNFERLYNRQHREMDPNDAANVAIRLWGTLTPKEKKLYENLDWNIYQKVKVPKLKRTPKLKSGRKKSRSDASSIFQGSEEHVAWWQAKHPQMKIKTNDECRKKISRVVN
nr:uncharacterized protein LOC108128608 [Drosophila bipectinata]